MSAPRLTGASMADDEGDEPDEGSAAEEDSDAMEAFDTFADAIGVPDEKRQAAYDAFRAAVKAC